MLSYGALLLARLDRKYEIHLPPMLTADIKESKAGHLTLLPLSSPSLSCESQISLLGRKTLLVILISRYRDLEISERRGYRPSFVRIFKISKRPFISREQILVFFQDMNPQFSAQQCGVFPWRLRSRYHICLSETHFFAERRVNVLSLVYQNDK